MFQPQPTPFAAFSSSYGIDVANAEIPEYAFQPTPLGQFVGGHAGGAGGAGATSVGAGVRGGPTAVDVFASPIFQTTSSSTSASANENSANNNHLPYNSIIPHHHQQHHRHQHHNHNNNNTNTNTNNNNHNSNNSSNQRQHQQHQQHHHHHSSRHHRYRRSVKMEPQSDLAQQEAAARDYKPQLQGPLVGDKTSSHAITAEYAKADPTFVAKTMALPQTYSHYRPIQGDGNCGWRAIGFAYFEILIRCGDITQVQSELARLTNFNDYIEKVGGQERWLFEDMVSETFELFEQVIAAMSSGHDPMDAVMAKFNDIVASQSLVYHLRLLASSWLKGNFAQYAPWIDGDVESYIQDTIMPVDREIDHMCLVLLSEVLLKPNIVLEIAYLDRSQGSEVNVHRIPDEANGQDPSTLGPIIYLLYRPGHYDILYREPQIPMPPIPTGPISLQVNRATSFTHHHDIQSTMPSLGAFSNLDLGTLALIPTFDSAALSPLSSPPAGSSPMTDPYAPSSPSPWMPQHFPESMPPPPPPQPQQQSPPQPQPTTPLTTHPLRFSKYNFPNLPEMVENNSSYEPAFTTNTFKNSHFNVAHYNNMNFQPEMYRPDADDEIPSGRGGGRKRSSEHCAVTKKESRG